MHAILPQMSYLHNIPLSHQKKNLKTDIYCTLMDVICYLRHTANQFKQGKNTLITQMNKKVF